MSRDNRGPELPVIASEFPASALDAVIDDVSQEELETIISKGESERWRRTLVDLRAGEITLQNKNAKDNSIRFKLYGRTSSYAMLAVQQVNAQVRELEIWEYRYNANEDHPQWNQYLLPEYKLDSFFDERVTLPSRFQMQSAKPYLDYELTPTAINITFNKWSYMRDIEADSLEAEGPLDPTLIKYRHAFKWNGAGFDEEKVKEAGYNDLLTFNSHVYEQLPGGPGPHEFDCTHGVSVAASSTLPKQGAYSYNAKNVIDDSNATAWSEGVEGSGVGEWIEFTITSNFRIGDAWQLGNGYNRNKDVWQSNNRVKKMKVLVDDQVVGYVMLSNVPVYQSFNIAPSWLKTAPEFRKGTRIRFVIEEVYKGSKYDDTLISYFVPQGNCG